MTSFVDQITSYADELEKNRDAQDFQNKINDCRAIEEKLLEQIPRLEGLARSYALLKIDMSHEESALFQSTFMGHFQRATLLLDTVRKIWSKDKETLRQHQDFGLLLGQLELCHDDFSTYLQQYWKKCELGFRDQFNVNKKLLIGIANIPGQSTLYFEYTEKLKQFDPLVKKIPTEPAQLIEIKSLTVSLSALKSQMQFDVPEDVQAFFALFNTHSMASVSLQALSPEVFQWLYQENLLDSFTLQRQRNV